MKFVNLNMPSLLKLGFNKYWPRELGYDPGYS